MRTVLVGFDSAWVDHPDRPGAITSARFEGNLAVAFRAPFPASFDAAADFIEDEAREADCVLVALDQPTIVGNATGGRPVERVAASVISSLRGGVQPANTGKAGMFGASAPIWRFLATLGACQDLEAARRREKGRFLMEVFPALALPSLVPAIHERWRAAKYNPANRAQFDPRDWPLVAGGIAEVVQPVPQLAAWCRAAAAIVQPRKADQDRLDAAICLTIAHRWMFGPREASLILGEFRTGYMVTPADEMIRARLMAAAEKVGVPWDDPGTLQDPPRRSIEVDRSERPARSPIGRHQAGDAVARSGRVETDAVYALLVPAARERRTMTYGEVADALGLPPHQGTYASLNRALNELSARNRKHGEPQIMSLVVSKTTGLPRLGFYRTLGAEPKDLREQRVVFECERDRCFGFDWPAT